MTTVNTNLFKKFRKLAVRQDGDGDETKVEVREDEEQSEKFQEIIDLLVAAGYFRARIKGLTPFDKVVGGMTWCIESCNMDIDVDLLFQENSTIGQKISLTEKIVAVLPKMKCPHRIEPHQIQGLDFIHIFPVIQWLVKRSMEFRQERAEFVRSYAVNQFNKTFITKAAVAGKQQTLEHLNVVNDAYRPRRFYKRKTALPADLTARVQITLLEYGLYGTRSRSSRRSSESDATDDQNNELQMQQLLSNMAISNEVSSDFNELSAEERGELLKHYMELQQEIGEGSTKTKEEKQLQSLEQQKILLEEQLNRLGVEKDSVLNEIVENENQLETIKRKQQEAVKTVKELEASVSDFNNVQEVEELVKLNDSLRQQEMQFKEQCKKELAELERKIEEAKNVTPAPDNEDQLDQVLERDTEKLKSLRLHLAKRNRIISVLQRQLDEVPSRPELAQYQRRFLELYNQVAAKHKETKQYFTLYNTLEDTKGYMQKELSLLNSIADNYPEAMLSSASREEFLKQFENIVESVKQSKKKIEQRLVEEKFKRDQLSSTLQGLVELQRRYVAAVRQLSIECKKFETLSAQQRS